MNKLKALMYGMGFGAGLMYLYDPQNGTRRRTQLRDRYQSSRTNSMTMYGKARRDLDNRVQGVRSMTGSHFQNEPVDDSVLIERVRSNLGTFMSNTRLINLEVQDGTVILSGPVESNSEAALLTRVAMMPGVKSVRNRLDPRTPEGNLPALMVGSTGGGMKGEWSPGIRMLAGGAGGMLFLTGMMRGGLMGSVRSVMGLGLLARGVYNKQLGDLLGMNPQEGAVDVTKSIVVNAPVEEVFEFWKNYENFPRFMRNIEEIRRLDGNRSHWVVRGPAGSHVEWDAETTQLVPNDTIAWHSVEGSEVMTQGSVRFSPAANGGTAINVRMSYTPPAGVLGHTIASVLGSDPKHEMDEDLARFKSLIEEGKTTTEGKTVHREEFQGGRQTTTSWDTGISETGSAGKPGKSEEQRLRYEHTYGEGEHSNPAHTGAGEDQGLFEGGTHSHDLHAQGPHSQEMHSQGTDPAKRLSGEMDSEQEPPLTKPGDEPRKRKPQA